MKHIILLMILILQFFNLKAQNNTNHNVNYINEESLIKEKLCRKWFLVQVLLPNYIENVHSFSDSYVLDTLSFNDTITERLILMSSNEYMISSKIKLGDKNNSTIMNENGKWILKDNLSTLIFNCNNKNNDNISLCSGWKIIELTKTTLSIRFQTRFGSIEKIYK